jgi:type IV secretory pathway TraG/TraD family ATPase VirD4
MGTVIFVVLAAVLPLWWTASSAKGRGWSWRGRLLVLLSAVLGIAGIAGTVLTKLFSGSADGIAGNAIVLQWILAVAYAVFAWFGRKAYEAERLAIASTDGLVRRGSRVIQTNGARGKGSREGKAIELGGVEIPRELEAQHFLMSGTTGTGKTQAINAMLRTIRKRGQRAVIADPGGGFYSRFAQPGDKLMNPFDGRTVDWSPFADIENDYDCERIARAIVPDGTGDGAQWHHYSQSLVAEVLRTMHRNGERSIKQLLYWLTSADQKELSGMLAGTPAAALCAKGNDRMLASTRAILSSYVGVFPYLVDEGRFSVREWVRDSIGEGWLFVTYRDDQMGMLRGLVATMLELAIVEGLSLSEDQERGLWFVMDEVDSLGKVTSLRAGLTKLRKYGGRCVLGLQTISQLRTTYGRDEAQTLLANCSTKLILRAGDAETARSMEDELGQQEIERLVQSDSKSKTELFGGSTSTSQQFSRQAAVMASEIMGLENLHGFIKLPGDAIHRVKLDYVGMPEVQPSFQR